MVNIPIQTHTKSTQETITGYELSKQYLLFVREILFPSILSSFRYRKMGSDEQLQFAIVIQYVNQAWQRSFVFMRDPKSQALYHTTKH